MDIRKPARVIGSTTVGSLQSGLYYGYLGLVDGILERLLEEMGQETTVVATGGLAATHRQRIEIHQARGRSAYAGRPAPHLGAKRRGEVRPRRRVRESFSVAPDRCPAASRGPAESFVENYFNYFTEIEEQFQRRRGGILLLSTLDWALIETWKDAGIPLEAVLRGIDGASSATRNAPRPARSTAWLIARRKCWLPPKR